MSWLLGQGQGHFSKMGYSDCQTLNSLALINYGISMATKVKVKVIPGSN